MPAKQPSEKLDRVVDLMDSLLEKMNGIEIPDEHFTTFHGSIYGQDFQVSYFFGGLTRDDFEKIDSGEIEYADLLLKLQVKLDGVTLTRQFIEAIGFGKAGQIVFRIFEHQSPKEPTS